MFAIYLAYALFKKKTLRTLRAFRLVIKLQIETSKLYFVWGFIYSIYGGVISILNAYVLAKFLASVSAAAFQQGSTRTVYQWLALLLGLEIVSIIVQNCNRIAETRFQQRIQLAATERFFTKLYELSQEQFENEAFTRKVGLAQGSVNQMWRILNELSWTLTGIVNFVGAIGAVVVVAPAVGLIVAVTVVPITLLRLRQDKANNKMYKETEPYERIAVRSQWMLTDPNMMSEIRLIGAFKNLATAWRLNTEKAQNITYAAEKKLARMKIGSEIITPAITFCANIYFFTLLIGSKIGIDRFIFLRSILDQASNSATTMSNSVQSLHDLAASLRNFSAVQDAPPAIPDGHVLVKRPLTIVFSKVSFIYPGSKQLILDDISFEIHPGSKLALVGENGAGKSTLIKLLLRQYLPTQGTITVNGVDIKDIKLDSYYKAISNLSQDFLIVDHLSIKDNLLMGIDRQVPNSEIQDAVELVGAQDFVAALPHKLSQRLDPSFEDGTGLSGGQLQRLGVARALLRNGDMMILDEPTSAIDAKGEYMIFNNLYKSHANRTALIVSHRFSTVRKAEKIIVMEKGKITEYGSHEELLAYNGLYKEMFEVQAEGYR